MIPLDFLKKNKTTLFVSAALVLGLGFIFIFKWKYAIFPPLFLFASLAMFLTMTWLGLRFLMRSATKKEAYAFVNTYLGFTAIKIFVVLAVLTIYLYFRKDHLFAVGLLYALTYLVFLVLEVTVLLSVLKSRHQST